MLNKKLNIKKEIWLGLALLAAVVGIDQLIKSLAPQYNIEIIRNAGLLFGIIGIAHQPTTLIIMTIGVILFAGIGIRILLKHRSIWVLGGILLVLGGVFSNLFDRIFLGYVRDMIDIKIWPVFNPADVFITIGAIVLIFMGGKRKTYGRQNLNH